MKVNVNTEQMKDAISFVSVYGSGIMQSANVIGLHFLGDKILRLHAFNGAWWTAEVEVDGPGEELYVPIRPEGARVISFFLSDEYTEFDVDAWSLTVGQANIKSLPENDLDDVSPRKKVNYDETKWVVVPEQVKHVAKFVPTNASSGYDKTCNLYVTGRAIFATDGFMISSYPTGEWGFGGYTAVPSSVVKIITQAQDDILFCASGDIVSLSSGYKYVTTTLSKFFSEEAMSVFRVAGDHDIVEGGEGRMSYDIANSIDAAIALGDEKPTMYMWASELGDRMNVYSHGSELGKVEGSVWAQTSPGFEIAFDPKYLKSMIPRGDMWKIFLVTMGESTTMLMVECEDGVLNFLMPMHGDPDFFNRRRSGNA